MLSVYNLYLTNRVPQNTVYFFPVSVQETHPTELSPDSHTVLVVTLGLAVTCLLAALVARASLGEGGWLTGDGDRELRVSRSGQDYMELWNEGLENGEDKMFENSHWSYRRSCLIRDVQADSSA